MDALVQDIRYALRILRMTPGFTSVSVLTLALGIVGTTLVFTAYSAVMLQPLPAREPERLTVLHRHFRKGGESTQFTIGDYRRIGEHNGVFPAVAAEGQYDTVLAQFPNLQSGRFDEPRQALVKLVSSLDYFDPFLIRARYHCHRPIRPKHQSPRAKTFQNNLNERLEISLCPNVPVSFGDHS